MKPTKDVLLGKWMQEFRKETTQVTYRSALRKFKKALGIADLGEYVKSEPNAINDLKTFLRVLEGKPSKTVVNYTRAAKLFLKDQGVYVPEKEWTKLLRRGFMPKRARAETRDKKPTKSQMKQILNYADIKCRSQSLFLISSGARIGETSHLKIEDFNLDADPPEAIIRSEYTKGGMGGRTVYFSYEARDAMKDWLKIKDTTSRRNGGGTYKDERMFPWIPNTARFMWNRACDKAGIGARDIRTGRRILHLHSLRKFFRTKIGLDDKITNALLGHSEYLDDAYLRLEQEGEIAKEYFDAMPNVSVYEVENQALKDQASAMERENAELKRRIEQIERYVAELRETFSKPLE